MFFLRLDFWGALGSLLGLTLLASYDVQFLKPLLACMPNVRRIESLKLRLNESIVKFIKSFQPVNTPSVLMTLQGTEVANFLKVFSNWHRIGETPQSVDVCAIFFEPYLQRGDAWVYVIQVGTVEQQQPPLAGPIQSSFVFEQLQNQTRDFVYTTGFLVMGLSAILSMLFIVLH